MSLLDDLFTLAQGAWDSVCQVVIMAYELGWPGLVGLAILLYIAAEMTSNSQGGHRR
jgi:hypothetical protein